MARLLGLAVLIGALTLMLSPAARAWLQRRLPSILLYGGVAALLLLVVAGRLDWLFALGGALIAAGARLLPAMLRYAPWLAQLFQARRAAPGNDRQERPAPRQGGMGAEEAREILGLGPEATTADVTAAHRRLMQRLHPDRGGSPGLAARLNEAREVLLQRSQSA